MTGLDGVRQRRLALPPGTGIANGVAWSPDGRMIATVPWLSRTGPPPPEAQRQPWSGKPDELAIHFTDANGNRLAEPRPVTGKLLLGWKSSRSIITISYDFLPRERDTATIEEIDLATGKAAVLSKVDHGHACEFFMEACLAQEFQLATGLIDRMGVTSSGLPDREPRLTGIALSLLVVTLQLAVLLVLVIRAVVVRVVRPRPRK